MLAAVENVKAIHWILISMYEPAQLVKLHYSHQILTDGTVPGPSFNGHIQRIGRYLFTPTF